MVSWKRKGFSLFLLVLLSSLFNASAAAAFSGSGSGTEGDPYIIMTADQLDEVRNELDAHYRLGADIDRQVKTGSRDTGDIRGVSMAGRGIAIECKDYQGRHELPKWLREAEVERLRSSGVTATPATRTSPPFRTRTGQ